ncbi:MAG: ATP-dependent zinc metalloprotease FtsH [Desulfovibrio sp.]|nr:ATP-dependent zinc metalloprotease FtsH [Desulfovibrio sp.]
MNQRNLFIWVISALCMLVIFNMFYQQPSRSPEMSYSEFLQRVGSQEVQEVTIQGQKLMGRLKNGVSFASYAPPWDGKLVERLLEQGVTIKASPPDDSPWYIIFLTSWAPMLLLIGVWIFFMRQMQGGGGKTMSFGRSRARLISQESAKITFDNVAGVDEAKEELAEVVDFLSNPKKFTRLGGRIPKGVLLVGPPGTGKTLLAKAVAGEAGVPFFSISGSDFVEMFVGVGASRVRDLFAQGKKNAPCLIFIDEIDAVGRQRGAGLGGGHDEREQTLNQLLVEMDGFEGNEGVILIAATNRPDVLDPALLRPGRFDRQVVVPPPDVRGRRQILEVHAKRTPLAKDVNLEVLAKGTPGFSGADLENLVNEAALLAAKENKDLLNMRDFENAKDKLLMGKERRTMVQSPEELKNTAYHESGHAIITKILPETDPIHKVSIIPRGRALGVTMSLPEEDRYSSSRTELENRIAILLGGRAAELVIFDRYTTGASDDIKRATKMARAMVCQLGMSEAVGPMAIGDQSQEVFIGREWVTNRDHSEATAQLVDAEVKRIIDTSMKTALSLLRDNIDLLHRMAGALLDRETLSGEEVDLIMKGESLPPLGEEESRRVEERRHAAAEARGKGGGAGGSSASANGGGAAADSPERVPKKSSPAPAPQGDSPPADLQARQPGDAAPPQAPAARSPLGAALSRAARQADSAPKTPQETGERPETEEKPDRPKADS